MSLPIHTIPTCFWHLRGAFNKSSASYIKYYCWVDCLVPNCWATSLDHSCIKSGPVYFTCEWPGHLSKQAKVHHFIKMEWVGCRPMILEAQSMMNFHKCLSSIYGSSAPCHAPVTPRLHEFRRGREDIRDKHHSGCQTVDSAKEAFIASVYKKIYTLDHMQCIPIFVHMVCVPLWLISLDFI